MGWYQDNFPGSPAARQRVLISRGLIIYSIVAGTAYYFMVPWCRRLRKELDAGNVFVEPRWLRERIDHRKFENRNILSSVPTVAELLKAKEEKDKQKRGDISGPDAPEEIIRTA